MVTGSEQAAPPVVRLNKVCKAFGSNKANDDITLDIRAGRILALLGENGAGKSTLMSILAGRYVPDSGQIEMDGRPVAFTSSRDAITAGIGMVYQHFMLVNSMTVAENVLLGQMDTAYASPARMERIIADLASSFGMEIDPSARVADLSMGERQRVEILKAAVPRKPCADIRRTHQRADRGGDGKAVRVHAGHGRAGQSHRVHQP